MVITSNKPTAPILPSHRFYEEAPEMISLPLVELLNHLPASFRKETSAEELNGRTVALPCRDLLAGNTPRLSLGQLNDLLPEFVMVPEGGDHSQKLNLPAGWVALYYRLVTRFEEIVPEKQHAPVPAASVSEPLASEESDKKPELGLVIEGEVITTKPAEDFSMMERQSAQASAKTEAAQNEAPAVVLEESPKGAPEALLAAVPEEPPVPPLKRGFFASLPIFRRNAPVKPVAEEHRLALTTTAAPAPEDSKNLALEPLWKLDPLDQIADPLALQALFMTEEKLTMGRVISMAGQLPGLRACILAHRDKVVCASNTSPGIDLQTLSGQAMTMLTQIWESSSKMGLGNVSGVTLHVEQGALSFLHNNELCLLVLHADRGFIPGVSERLQQMLYHLARAEALPSGSSAQQSLPI